MNAGLEQSREGGAVACDRSRVMRIALLGNPNTGKTTLFNALTGLRHKTSNFPGTTQEARIGHARSRGGDVRLIDLPGVYSLDLEQGEAALCLGAIRGAALPGAPAGTRPDAAIVVVDATNLSRGLALAGEAMREGLPVVVGVNMIDCARREGLAIDASALQEATGAPARLICARSGEGLEALLADAASAAALGVVSDRGPGAGAEVTAWAERAASLAARRSADAEQRGHRAHSRTDRVDRALTHSMAGPLAFALVMTALFWAIFSLAQFPMAWIDTVFATLGGGVRAALPPGFVRDLLSEGVVAGVGATLVFLPQIALLFFLISLLEDSGYLARAAFVADRALRPFGLSGHAFVPLLSSHACALPGIIACRGVPDARERLATILVAPFMSCTARMPVYVLLVSLLFPARPLAQAVAFTGCYALGAAAGLLSAIVARRTVARGAARAMALELPSYKTPSVRSAAITAYDRAAVFLKKAGTNILALCILLWWLGAYPRVGPPPESVALRHAAASAVVDSPERAARTGLMLAEADRLERTHAARRSYIGRLGEAIEPAVRPLGWDRQLAIGVLASFAAREVFVSTMAVVATGDESDDERGVRERLGGAMRDDGVTPVFTPAASWSLLVYYVLAMQCLPTLAVTAREAGGVKWALLQLGWMTLLAYGAAFAAFRIAGGA